MSYEEQLQAAIKKANIELCQELLNRNCNLSKLLNRKLPLNLACENNCYEIAELLIEVIINFPVVEFFF
jgi:ankyrin repeat protein